ncbi:MAG: carcinine hydrolase/isopenicillin-N N-acyltransferase family protein [archaeon]
MKTLLLHGNTTERAEAQGKTYRKNIEAVLNTKSPLEHLVPCFRALQGQIMRELEKAPYSWDYHRGMLLGAGQKGKSIYEELSTTDFEAHAAFRYYGYVAGTYNKVSLKKKLPNVYERAEAPNACTAFGVIDDTGKVFVGKNNDYYPESKDMWLIRKSSRVGIHDTLDVSMEFSAGTSGGINLPGLTVLWNQLSSYNPLGRDRKCYDEKGETDDLVWDSAVMPNQVAQILLLECDSVDDAMKKVQDKEMKTIASYIMLVADKKRIVVIEATKTPRGDLKFEFREPESTQAGHKIIGMTNHPHSSYALDQAGGTGSSSRIRYKTMHKLLQNEIASGYGEEDYFNLLKNHEHGGLIFGCGKESICNKGYEVSSLNSIVVNVTEKKLFVSDGQPCKGSLEEISKMPISQMSVEDFWSW